ncbi:hypothetical protein FSP39_017472 [Pinctada imbricata]|uniref:VWFD domain-containing protein n=1 Tax=Pinctada imbricata TaxID=66713 RepID=A0AA89C1N1_PINIB|nr:hypothetical protein FSP39_017472 [Pinctada imbricata]
MQLSRNRHLNYGMQKFVSSLSGSTSFTQCLNTQNFMLSGDMNYNVPNYTQCARQLTSDLTSAMKTPRYGFYDLCMAASNYNTCLSNEFKDVNGPYEMIMMATMNDTHRSISEFLKNDCAMIIIEPADCRSDMAIACVVSYAVEAMNIGLLSGDNMYTTCSSFERVQKCVMMNTKYCSATTHMMAAKSLMQVTFMARSFCHKAMMVHEMMNMATDDDMNRDTTNMTMRNMSADMIEGYGRMMNFSDREGGMGDKDSMRSGPFDMSKMREEIESRVESFMMGNARMISDLSLDGKEHVLDAIMELGKVGMEDEPCVDPMKYRDMATCNPQRAFDCMAAVDKEMLNPFMTRERLCMKHALAVRCYVLMSHGCNQMTAHTMKITFDYMMYKVGDRCETHLKSPCMDMKSKCQLWEVPKCLNELHMAVSYGRYFLPGSTTQMCMSAEKAKDCVTEKIEHCSKEVQYHVMEMLYPATELMTGICDVMPAMGCATSFMWKAASITLLTGQIMKEGAEYQSMEYWMNMNKEMMERGMNSTLPKPTVTMEDVLKNMSSTHNASNNVDAKGVMEVMKWLSQITRKSCDKDMMGGEMDGKMTMMSLMEGVGAVIKYSFMEAGMTKWDSLFKSMVEMGIMEDQDSNIMKAVYEAVKETYEEYGIKKEDSELMPMVIKHTVEMADSTQLLHFYYAKIAKAKIDSMMAKSGMEKEKDSDEKDEEDEEEMMEWIKKEVAMEMKRMMPNNTKAPISLEDGMKYVKMSLDAHKMKKLSSCYQLWESYHCLESKFHLVPQESRPLVNVTIGAMLKMATHLCEPTKCFSCKGAISNEECNRQMPQNCMESRGCYTEVRHGKITKGCAYWFQDYEGDDHTARYCSNNYCNHPMMTVWKEDDKRCKLEEAVTCMFDFMPSLLLSQTPNMRQAFKTSHCMTKSTEGCMMEEGKYINHVGEMIREATLKGTCSGGDRAEYECGLRSLFALSQAVHNPITSRKTVCQMLNSTYLVMVEAMKKGTCNEYEAVESYYGLQSILEIIGDDYCPGVIPNDPTLCSALLMNQINDSNSMCDVKGVHDCMDDEELAMKVKYLEYANGRDIDQFCRETHSAMMCMMKKSAKCSLDVQKELSKNTTAKYGFINNICPMVKITHELCTPVEMPARKCNVGMASLCLASFDPKKVNLCTMTDTQIDQGLRCMSENMTGCNALQMSPMMYSMQWVLTTMVLNCSTHTPRMLTKTGGMSYGSIDLLFKEYFNYVFDIKDASFRTDMPMAKMLDTMMFFKTSSMAAEWNATKLYMDLDPRLRNVTDTVGMVMGQNLKMDRKGGLAKCMLHLASHTSRALMYPVFSNMIMCEAMTTTQACLRALDLLPVTQMDVWIMLDHIQNEREKVCMTYIEDVGKIGYALMNLSSSVMNSTAPGQGQVKKIVGDMVNGTLNMTMHNKDDLMMVARDVIDMFLNINLDAIILKFIRGKRFEYTYNIVLMCYIFFFRGLHEMNKTLAPMMGKCSQWHKMAYHGMMQWIHNSTMGMCESEYMNFTVETTCQADASVMCLKYIMPYLNGQSTPKDKMCRNLQATSLCVQLHTRTCSSNEMVNVTRTMDYIHSIVGDSCPYITAASKCPRIANTPVPNKCEAEMAYQCGDILGVGTDGKIDASVCSKLPEMFQCISANLSGCSAFVLAEAMSYAEWALDQVNKVCSQEAMANMLYSQLNCQPPNVCSLTKAYKCYDVIADQPTCTTDQANSILACARQHLLGCNMFQVQIFNNTMGIGRDLAPTCAAYTVDMAVVDQADRTDMAGLNHCAESFRHNLTAALLDPNNAYARFCKSFTEANECMMYGLNDEEEMFLRHLLGYSYNVTSEMVTALCRDESMFQQNAMMETTRKDEPSTCMLDMAAQCLSASAFPTIMASTMTMEDKHNFCDMWAEDSMYCMRRNTFGCDKWVHDMVREDTEGSYCVAADMLNNCKLNAMKEEPEELPSCMDKEKKGNETCDFTRAYDCLLYLSAELENPYMDCNMMHRPYTEAMQCFERHAGNCGEGAYPVFSVVYYKAVTTVRKKCPMLTYAPCMEPSKCQMDEADHCIATLTKFLHTDKLQNDHICMAFDMAKACIDDRLKHCSMFAKATVQERLEATKYITTMITQKPCHENLELCLHRFLYSTMSVIHAEVVLANLTKHMDMIANKNDSSAVGFVRTTYSMLHTMTSDLREYGDVHYKVKAMMCKAIHGSMTCAKNHLTKSNLSANKVNFINVTLTRMFNVMSGMCGSMQTCSLMEEPPTCQIMPAAMVAMSQVAIMFMNTTQMCKAAVPASLTSLRVLRTVLKDAKDTMCRVNVLCQEDKAQQCINDFMQYIGTNQACSEYEKLLACVSTNTKYCENKTELGRDIEAVGRQCEPFPEFRVYEASPILRLVEGGLTRTIEVSMASSPNNTCPAGSRCTVQMKVEIHNNMDTIPSCPNGDFISQVVVPSGNTDACSYTFTTDNWQRPMRLPLVATSDMLSDSTQDVNVTVTASKYVDNVLTLARAVAKYQVVVADTDQPAACVAVGSGGLVTFDGMYVTNRYRGEFVLYKNTHTDRPYQVNIKNQACENDRTKTCTCAAMVKSVDDVFVVDYCSGAVNPMKLYKNGPLSYRTKLYRENNGNLISVVLPTGAVVAISIKNKVLSVILIPSSLDWLNTEGLCGWYEGNKYNDMRLPITQTTAPSAGDFIQAWRVQNGGSLSKGTTAYTNYQPPSYCTCAAEPGQVMRTCQEMLISKSCDINLGQDFTAEMEMLAERSNSVQTRRKRQVADPNDADYVPPELVWPTNSGITLDQATAECTRVLQQSNIAQLCQAYTGDSQTIMVQACAEVIQVNDDLTAASVSTLANIQCMVQVSMTSSSQSSDPALEAQKNAILNQMCDNDCSGNGLCKDGDCQCVGDYLGSDCSIDGSKPPVLTSLENSGECYLVDGQTTACKSVFISGENFAENGNMKCHFQPVTVTANAAPQPTGSAVVTDANFLTSNLLMCAIPDSMTTNTILRGIHIAVSYEGDVSRASQAALFLAYSPTCYMCNMTTGMCMTDVSQCICFIC